MNTLSTLEKYEYIFGKNSNGVREIDSGKPGKTFTITACTHGNEPAGIDTMYYLLEEFKISEKIISGKVQFIVVNIEAMQQNSRFVNTDLNRVFDFGEKNIDTSEYSRAKEISDFLLKSDYVFDLHSSSTPSKPFLIPCKTLERDLIDTLPIDYCLDNFIYLLHGCPLIRFVENGNKNAKCCVLEAGYHNDALTIKNTISVVLKGLFYYGFIGEYDEVESGKIVEYFDILECMTAKNMDSKILYSDSPTGFDKIEKGDCVLFDGEEKYYAQNDGYIILPTMSPTYIGEEICFIGK